MKHFGEFNLADLQFTTVKLYDYRCRTTVEYINIECAFDIETTSTYVSDTKFAFMYEWTFGICDNKHIYFGRDWEEFLCLCNKLSKHLKLNANRRIVCYIHNMGFEFQFMRKYFNFINVFSTEERKPIKAISDLGIEFRDSYILSASSLDIVAKNLTYHKISKLVGNLDYDLVRTKDTVLSEDELAYCNNDVEILLAYISEQIKAYGDITKIPLTNTSRVRQFVRNNCLYTSTSHKKSSKSKFTRYRNLMRELVLNGQQYAMLKRCFMGGFVHASLLHSGKVLCDADSIDFISSYPYVMISEKFPMSRPIKVDLSVEDFESLLKSDYGIMFNIKFYGLHSRLNYESYFSESKCETLDGALVHNGRVYEAKLLQTTITNVDFEIIRANYTWDNIEIGTCYKFYMEYLPKPIIMSILELYNNKTTLKGVDGKEYEYNIAKSMLNSVYGMMVTDIVREDIIYNIEDCSWVTDFSDTSKCVRDISKYNKSIKRFLYYPWGVWTTAYARRNLWCAICSFGNDYVYSDTDSIKCINIDRHMDFINAYNDVVQKKLKQMCGFRKISYSLCEPKTLNGIPKLIGTWEWETKDNKYIKFKTLGAKRYMYQDNDGLHITVAGVPKQGAVCLKNDLNNFCKDFIFDGNTTGKKSHFYIFSPEGIYTDEFGNEVGDSIDLEPCDYQLDSVDKYEFITTEDFCMEYYGEENFDIYDH